MPVLKWYYSNIGGDPAECFLFSEEELLWIYSSYGDGQGQLKDGYFLQELSPDEVETTIINGELVGCRR